jgi:hypothetical protein
MLNLVVEGEMEKKLPSFFGYDLANLTEANELQWITKCSITGLIEIGKKNTQKEQDLI